MQSNLFENSLELARKVLPFLGERGIPAIPENYMIFYLYFEGEVQVVRRVVDEHLNSGVAWDQKTSQRVFDQLFGSHTNLNLFRINERLARQVESAAQELVIQTRQGAQAAEATSQSLSRSLDQIEDVNDTAGALRWLKETIADVSRMKDVSDGLNRSLREKGSQLQVVVQSLAKIEVMALTDELTKLANRRAWDDMLSREFARFKRYGSRCSLIMADLDNFKKINDQFGHLVGDEALRQVARLLREGLRSTDFAARFGGEEFSCLLPETELDGARSTAERLCQSISHTQFTVRGQPVRLSASFGVSAFTPDDNKPSQAIERADQALYLAKNQGKNQVRVQDELTQA